MKIVDTRPVMPRRTMRATAIPTGTVFTGNVGDIPAYRGLFLRTHAGLVMLDNPDKTWTVGNLTIFDYQPMEVEVRILGPAQPAGDDGDDE